MWRVLVFGAVLAGCSVSATSDPGGQLDSAPAREPIRIPLTLYIVDEAGAGDSAISSQRTTDGVEVVADDIAPIWGQADVIFDPVRIHEIQVPSALLEELVLTGEVERFFSGAGLEFDTPDVGVINGFYVSEAAGYNGFTPLGSRVFFVADEPTVFDERVSSHEIGHILGLDHVPDDPQRLMFSGTNGTNLTDVEQQQARDRAEEILDDAP